jgi:uncharacterized peroxidase-related enzyme
VLHHGAGLRALLRASGKQEAEVQALLDALAADYRRAPLAPADRAMLDYAFKLTVAPATIVAADVDMLRAAGFDDRAIHDICAITGYYAFVNRMADGLGVELEARFDRPHRTSATPEPPVRPA